MEKPKIPPKHKPRGFEIIHEDQDLIAVNKSGGLLTVAALWNQDNTVHSALNRYVQKGQPKSKKCVYVVHRLDQATTGVVLFAKSENVQQYLKNNWSQNTKTYYAITQGQFKKKSGLIESYLKEDEDYFVHSSHDQSQGKLARTEYTVVHEAHNLNLVKINLLTGKKNQIRVHMSENQTPILGDEKYGKTKSKHLFLHAYSLLFEHPFKKQKLELLAPLPEHFQKTIAFEITSLT